MQKTRGTRRAKMSPPANQLLARLPVRERRRLLRHCRPCQLNFEEVLCEPGARMRHVYFPNRGLISLLTPVQGYPNVEVGLVGREGFAGIPVYLGAGTSPVTWLVQGGGDALRMEAAAFTRETARSPPLRDALNRYLHAFMVQIGQTAACNSRHRLGPRLARWLLMTQDRMQSDTFPVTHEFLARMLNVRRAGVTRAAGILQGRKLVRYRRGIITVLDRPALERAACDCYRAVHDVARRILL
jgi:CRP-like cAMP-binding protein